MGRVQALERFARVLALAFHKFLARLLAERHTATSNMLRSCQE